MTSQLHSSIFGSHISNMGLHFWPKWALPIIFLILYFRFIVLSTQIKAQILVMFSWAQHIIRFPENYFSVLNNMMVNK
jgi:hypothetical protein